MKKTYRILLTVSAMLPLALATACGSKDDHSAKDKANAAADQSAVKTAKPVPSTGPADPALVLKLDAIAACEWDGSDYSDCEPYDSWMAAAEEADGNDDSEALGAKRAATLVNRLSSDDLAERRAAAHVIIEDSAASGAIDSTPSFAQVLFAAINAEQDEEVRDLMALAFVGVDVEKAKLTAEVVDKAANGPMAVRTRLIRTLATSACPRCLDALYAAATDPEFDIRQAAILSLRKGMDDARTCEALATVIENNDGSLVASAVDSIGYWGDICGPQLERAMTALQKHAKAGKLHEAARANLKSWLANEAVTDKHKAAAKALMP